MEANQAQQKFGFTNFLAKKNINFKKMRSILSAFF